MGLLRYLINKCFLIYFNFLMLISNCKYSIIAQSVKNLPAVQETWIRFLGWEDSLEKEVATHSSILDWRIPWTEEPGGVQSLALQESDMA